jgi:hypothetical protein
VRPTKFDAARFTQGAGETRFFRLTLNDETSSAAPNAAKPKAQMEKKLRRKA